MARCAGAGRAGRFLLRYHPCSFPVQLGLTKSGANLRFNATVGDAVAGSQ